jgi:hypothetical protein
VSTSTWQKVRGPRAWIKPAFTRARLCEAPMAYALLPSVQAL